MVLRKLFNYNHYIYIHTHDDDDELMVHKAHTYINIKVSGLKKKVAVFKRLTTMMSEREREKKST